MKKLPLLSELPARLLLWYRGNRRDLPWRHTRDPYAIMVSESMLQQTRVETVVPYYETFLRAFPDVFSLARAADDTLMKHWQGLGYYRRARLLKKAAEMIAEGYGGVFPREPEKIRMLPGVGDYTAGAIASISFGLPCAAVDGNVLRVVARYTGDASDVSAPETRRRFAAMLQKVYPERDCGDFTQSMMDLGATVCLPGASPRCEACPLADLCTAKRENLAGVIPAKKPPAPRRIEKWDVFFLVCDGRVALVRRPATGLLANLYGFPMTPGFVPVEKWARSHGKWRIDPAYKEAKHLFSHIEWHMRCYRAETDTPSPDFIWATPEELRGVYPIPNAFRVWRFFL
ncbi:MAG: A/G-specific adenine glycosylase [Victivallaceae bacterium]|nr:A/G-specific adenine glycosylase [Victivallaceae bacterium]